MCLRYYNDVSGIFFVNLKLLDCRYIDVLGRGDEVKVKGFRRDGCNVLGGYMVRSK